MNSSDTIQVTFVPRSVYGVDINFPAQTNEFAQLVCDLAGTRTISPRMVSTLEAYGIVVKQSENITDYK